jgi:leucyl/phenylalanyl-tRNA--protein transferase
MRWAKHSPPHFLNPELADAMGLVGVGGDLRPEWLLEAYQRGIFPWYDEASPILWWSPDPRAILELDSLHVPRRLQRTIRSKHFTVTINRAFGEVICGCADRPEGTWLSQDMMAAYQALHRLGHAHSVEAWTGGKLAGGIYGVAIRGLFAGESMFTRRRDGSKVALVHLVQHLRERGYQLFDIQMCTAHTARLGAIEIPRTEYLARLRNALSCQATFTEGLAV